MRLLWYNLATDADDPILGFTQSWARAVSARVEHIDIVTMRSGRIDSPGNVQVHSVGKEKGFSRGRRVAVFYRTVLETLRSNRIDACFSHMMPLFTVLSAPILKSRRIPIVTWYAHPSVTVTLRLAHHLSDCMVTSLPTTYRYRKDKLVVIGQGIDTKRFEPRESPPHGIPHLLCAGRLSPVKEHPTLLKAFALVCRRRESPLHLTILGNPARPSDEDYAASLRDLSRRLGIETRVRFVPGAPPAEMADWYRKCTVHVNMTPAGFGDKVALEAMACGRPCITANFDFRETLGRFAPALLYRHGNEEDLADKLSTILDQPRNERDQMGGYLREQVVRLHGLESLADRIVQMLETLRRTPNSP